MFMGFVNTIVGVIALIVGGGVIWGILQGIQMLVLSMGLAFTKYSLYLGLGLFISYFIGGAIQDYRSANKKV